MSNVAGNIVTLQELQVLRDLIEKEITDFLTSIPKLEPLSSAVSYVMQTGGKRIRPLIALSLIRDLGKRIEDYSACAVALELLHISSLVHDDLPALDNDSMRRGQKTCHVKFSEATAILTGDILISFAMSYVSKAKILPLQHIKIVNLLSSAFSELCYGQQLDLNPEKSSAENSNIALLKTGALFAASVAIGFAAASENPSDLRLAKETGLQIGHLYQICDDIADQNDSVTFKGREESSDKRNQKNTFYTDTAENTLKTIRSVQEKIQLGIAKLSEAHPQANDFPNFREVLNLLFTPFKDVEISF